MSSDGPLVVWVSYPAAVADTFKMDYYLETHVPLVQARWSPHGLKSWLITKQAPETGWCVVATLFWESAAAFEKAKQADGKEVLGDIPNFSSVSPTITSAQYVEQQSGVDHFS